MLEKVAKQSGRRGDHAYSNMERKRRHYSRSRSRSRSPERSERHEDRRRDREKKRRARDKEREQMKALETPEEKRERRLAKKEQKELRRRQKMGWDKQMIGYSNVDNPFGDEHLTDRFVWQKKREVDGVPTDLTKKEEKRRDEKQFRELRSELEKVKKRRLEREREREAREEETVLLQRMREAENFKEWEDQEDKFHLEQARLRSNIRIEGGRAKPIDVLAKYINTSEEDMDIEMQEPYHLLRGLNVVDLEDLLEDIRVYHELEKDIHFDYWNDMTIVCEEELHKLKRLEEMDSGSGGADRRGGINTAVANDVSSVFKGKTYGQLLALEQQIDQRIDSGNAVDIGYWESLLQQLKAHMARARLRDRHQKLLRNKLFQLKQEQAEQFGLIGTPLFPLSAAGPSGEASGESSQSIQQEKKEEEEPSKEGTAESQGTGEEDESDTLIAEEDLLQKAYDEYETIAYSPKLLKASDFLATDECEIVDAEVDLMLRTRDRESVIGGGKPGVKEDKKDERNVEAFKHLSMTRDIGGDGFAEEEYDFNAEVKLEQEEYVWQSKYRPRKPRFFNRVHTGFEWNKYNQTHYDTDNPPPKIVQGYKFNIFFPDLINKRQTPSYTITPCKDDPEFGVLRFHAGPPYEDIGFKIVSREWDYSWKHGFKCQFNNNILQLWFRFKRYRYRR